VCIFLGRALRDPRVRRADRSSKVKFANLVHVTHRDEVEPPFTDWLREAYQLQDAIGLAKPGEAKTVKVGTAKEVKPAKAPRSAKATSRAKTAPAAKRPAARRRR
jgi:hypothetical protein